MINIDTIAEKSDLGYMAMIEGNKRSDDIEYDDEGLNVNDSSDVKKNMDMQRIVEGITQVTEVLSEMPSNN